MHYFLKEALLGVITDCERPNELKSEDKALADRARARAAKGLLLHNEPNDVVEAWLATEFPEEPTAVRNLVSARPWPVGGPPEDGGS